jgi:hypothetical protein
VEKAAVGKTRSGGKGWDRTRGNRTEGREGGREGGQEGRGRGREGDRLSSSYRQFNEILAKETLKLRVLERQILLWSFENGGSVFVGFLIFKLSERN